MKLDPRTKLLMIVVMTTLAIFAKDVVYLLALFIITILFNVLIKADILYAIKRLRHLISLIIFIALVQSLTVREGVVLLAIKRVTLLTTGGLFNGLEFALRMGIIIFASLIASTEQGRGMIDALISLKIPYELAFMVSIAIRFIPMFSEEFRNRLIAIRMRGIHIKKLKLSRKLKLYTYLLSPTVNSAILNSHNLAMSMEARGFRAYPKRTTLKKLRLKINDYIVIMVILAIIAVFVWLTCTIGGII